MPNCSVEDIQCVFRLCLVHPVPRQTVRIVYNPLTLQEIPEEEFLSAVCTCYILAVHHITALFN